MIILIPIIQLVITLILGVFILWIYFKYLKNKFKKYNPVEDLNLAIAIFIASNLFAITYIMSAMFISIKDMMTILNSNLGDSNFSVKCFGFLFIILLTSLIIGALSNYIAEVLFDKLTSDVDELNEIAKGNLEYSILLGVIIICIAILVNPALSGILQAMIPYPDVVRFN
jgi:hypothetical protein